MYHISLKGGFVPIIAIAILAILSSSLVVATVLVQQRQFFKEKAAVEEGAGGGGGELGGEAEGGTGTETGGEISGGTPLDTVPAPVENPDYSQLPGIQNPWEQTIPGSEQTYEERDRGTSGNENAGGCTEGATEPNDSGGENYCSGGQWYSRPISTGGGTCSGSRPTCQAGYNLTCVGGSWQCLVQETTTTTQTPCQACVAAGNSASECSSVCNVAYITPTPPPPTCTCPNGSSCPDGLYSHCPSEVTPAPTPTPLPTEEPPSSGSTCGVGECGTCEEYGGICRGWVPNCSCTFAPTSPTLKLPSPTPTPVIQPTIPIATTVVYDTSETQKKHDELQAWCIANQEECQQRMEQNDKELLAAGVLAPAIAAAAFTSPIWGPEAVGAASPFFTTGGLSGAYVYGQTLLSSLPTWAQIGLTGLGLAGTAATCQSNPGGADCAAAMTGIQLAQMAQQAAATSPDELLAAKLEQSWWEKQYAEALRAVSSTGTNIRELPTSKFGFGFSQSGALAYFDPSTNTITLPESTSLTTQQLQDQISFLSHEYSHAEWLAKQNYTLYPPLPYAIANERASYSVEATQVYSSRSTYGEKVVGAIDSLSSPLATKLRGGTNYKQLMEILAYPEQSYLWLINSGLPPITNPAYLLPAPK